MADDVTVGGVRYSTDEVTTINGVAVPAAHVQRMRLGYGVNGTFFSITPTQPMPVARMGSGTIAGVTANTSGTANTNSQLLAADPLREGLIITNVGTVSLRIALGFATSATARTVDIPPGRPYEVPDAFVTAAVNGQASVATSPVQFTVAT